MRIRITVMYDETTSKPNVVLSGWKSVGMYCTVQMGAKTLLTIDSFSRCVCGGRELIKEELVNLGEDIKIPNINPREEIDEANSELEYTLMKTILQKKKIEKMFPI